MTQLDSVTLTADLVVLRPGHDSFEILLIKRGRPPFVGMYALPGGKVNRHETARVAAHRELEEETGIQVPHLEQVAIFSDPGRDPRGRFVSIVFLCLLDTSGKEATAGDDAAEVTWLPVHTLPDLAFDHTQILHYVLTSQAVRLATIEKGQ